jgi:uncharacterized protein
MNTSKTPVHFEIPVDDMERAQKFYKGLFGWNIVSAGENFDDYFIVQTVPTDEKGMLKEPGINGGMMKRSNPGQPIINYISVDNVDESLAKLEELGGSILMPKMPITGIGWNCVVKDTEGNSFGMLQEDSSAA